jgi:hypothetical protein
MLTNITALQNGAGIKPIIPEKLLKNVLFIECVN